MYPNHTRKFDMLVRITRFGDENPQLSSSATLAGQAFRTLGQAVTELREHRMARQESAARGRKAKRLARLALIEQIDAVNRNARGIPRHSGVR